MQARILIFDIWVMFHIDPCIVQKGMKYKNPVK